jgi:hypothetical protein
MKNLYVGVKNVLLWSHERGSWQYDLLCLLIIAVIFLIPSSYFEDRDRTPPQAKWRAATANESTTEVPTTGAVIWSEELKAFLERGNKPPEMMNLPKEAILQYLADRHQREIVMAGEPEPFTNAEGKVAYRVWYRVK